MSDAGTGTVLRLEAPAPVRGLALVAGGTSVSALLVGMREARWSCADGRFLGEVTYRGPPPTAATIAPAGDRLAIATGDGGVRILDAATLETRSEMPPAQYPRAQLAFSPDGKLLAGFARGRHLELTVWNVGSATPLPTFGPFRARARGNRLPSRRAHGGNLRPHRGRAGARPHLRPPHPDAAGPADGVRGPGIRGGWLGARGRLVRRDVLVWETARCLDGATRRGHSGRQRARRVTGWVAGRALPEQLQPAGRAGGGAAPRISGQSSARARAPLGIAPSTDVAFVDRIGARIVSARGTTLELRDLGG